MQAVCLGDPSKHKKRDGSESGKEANESCIPRCKGQSLQNVVDRNEGRRVKQERIIPRYSYTISPPVLFLTTTSMAEREEKNQRQPGDMGQLNRKREDE